MLLLMAGVVLGVSGTLLVPRLAGPYLPAVLPGRVEHVEGEVVAKQREPDRLLLTVLTPQGAILAIFRQKVPEIDLLVDLGDHLTLALRRYEPFVEDPRVQRVRKEEVPDGEEPGPGPAPSPGKVPEKAPR
ncbi:MAG: hypothetical protein HYV08_18320 [Deltaproteobacteria bacterium]|nr:hypothetical protein [Deltaproteobacteria bacterium]